MILNLKNLNQDIECHHFKMDTLLTALTLITPGCYMASIDLKDAYYSVPIDEQNKKSLCFMWTGNSGNLIVCLMDQHWLQGSLQNSSSLCLHIYDSRGIYPQHFLMTFYCWQNQNQLVLITYRRQCSFYAPQGSLSTWINQS